MLFVSMTANVWCRLSCLSCLNMIYCDDYWSRASVFQNRMFANKQLPSKVHRFVHSLMQTTTSAWTISIICLIHLSPKNGNEHNDNHVWSKAFTQRGTTGLSYRHVSIPDLCNWAETELKSTALLSVDTVKIVTSADLDYLKHDFDMVLKCSES